MTVVSARARTTVGQTTSRFSMVNVTAGLNIRRRVSVLTRWGMHPSHCLNSIHVQSDLRAFCPVCRGDGGWSSLVGSLGCMSRAATAGGNRQSRHTACPVTTAVVTFRGIVACAVRALVGKKAKCQGAMAKPGQ